MVATRVGKAETCSQVTEVMSFSRNGSHASVHAVASSAVQAMNRDVRTMPSSQPRVAFQRLSRARNGFHQSSVNAP